MTSGDGLHVTCTCHVGNSVHFVQNEIVKGHMWMEYDTKKDEGAGILQ